MEPLSSPTLKWLTLELLLRRFRLGLVFWEPKVPGALCQLRYSLHHQHQKQALLLRLHLWTQFSDVFRLLCCVPQCHRSLVKTKSEVHGVKRLSIGHGDSRLWGPPGDNHNRLSTLVQLPITYRPEVPGKSQEETETMGHQRPKKTTKLTGIMLLIYF